MNPKRNIQWAAGLFEGGGSACVVRNGKYQRTMVSVDSTDKDVLEAFGSIIGVGTLYGPYPPQTPTSKPYYRWRIYRQAEVPAALKRLLPYMLGRRRQQIEKVLTHERKT